MTNRVELAKVALKHGRTRGQFIRDNASPDTDRKDLQSWSDAYTAAMNPEPEFDRINHGPFEHDVV